MKRFILIICIVIVTATLSVPTYADWNAGEPNKWVQLPDLQDTGIDVLATTPMKLADDFECTETGYITGIHIWGSWLNDRLPMPAIGGPGDANNVRFRLSIFSDIPAGVDSYSRPGELLQEWFFDPGTFDVSKYAVDVNEGWLNPPYDYNPKGDTVVWQYNFLLDKPFEQMGTEEEPIVYWLALSAVVPTDPNAFFGWKTSTDHWNDDAVWSTPGASWQELRYNFAHPFEGDSMDLAFVITPEPATIMLLGTAAVWAFTRKNKSVRLT